MGCGPSKSSKNDGNSNELQSPQQQQNHAAQNTSSGAAAGAGGAGAVGGAQTGKGEKAVRNKSNPVVYFDMEQDGKWESTGSCLRAPSVPDFASLSSLCRAV